MVKSVWVVTVTDGANFNAKMGQDRAFSTEQAARGYGYLRICELRAEREVDDGETDEAFILAIDYDVTEIPFDQSPY